MAAADVSWCLKSRGPEGRELLDRVLRATAGVAFDGRGGGGIGSGTGEPQPRSSSKQWKLPQLKLSGLEAGRWREACTHEHRTLAHE